MNYLFYGTEQFLIKQKINEIINKNIDFEADMNTSYFDMNYVSMEDMIADCQTIPFFASHKVVVAQNCTFLGTVSNTSSLNLDVLESYLSRPNDSTILILCLNEEKLDKRKKIVKFIQKNVEVQNFSMFNDYERTKFVNEEAKKYKISFDSKALQLFYERVGYSPTMIHNEIDKLSLYSNHITYEDVENLVHRPLEDDVFVLFKVIMDKNMNKTFSFWNDFKELNIEPIALIAMLASQYRFLYQVKVLARQNMSNREIAKELSAHPYRVEKTMELCYKISLKEISEKLNELATLDQNIKAGKVDKNLGFDLFLLQSCK